MNFVVTVSVYVVVWCCSSVGRYETEEQFVSVVVIECMLLLGVVQILYNCGCDL